jgi:signal transduction histidine kinase
MTLLLGGFVILGVGSLLTARWILNPLEDLARVARALGAGDLRARSGLRRDDELGDLSRTFDEMAERIERLVLAEKELLANVSHELRTPLSRLRVAIDIACEADPERGRALAEMGDDLAEIEALIHDILTATRLEIARGSPASSHFALHLDDTACERLVERAAERFRAKHAERPLHVESEPALPPVRADAVLLRRVFDNLLENAHKYSPDPRTPVTLRLRRDAAADVVAVEVIDAGMGIAPDDLPHLFVPFFRSDRSRARGTGGVGLGLTLAKRIIEAHHGTITVTSTLGIGTMVRVVLPRADSSPDSCSA